MDAHLPMLFETTLQLLEASLEAKMGKYLTSPEKEILKAAWHNEREHPSFSNTHRLQAWGYTNKAHLRGLRKNFSLQRQAWFV